MSRRPAGERAMTAAERQRKRRARLAAERPPQHDPRDAEMSRLQAEVAALRERLHNRAEPKAATAGEDQAYLDRLATAGKLAEALPDPESRRDALRQHRKLYSAFVNFDRALRRLEERVGAPGRDRKRAKIQRLVDASSGAYEEERQNAAGFLARLNAPPPRSVTDPEPLPKTAAEMLARRGKRKR